VEIALTGRQIGKLKGLAQLLDPLAKVGRAGLSEAFVKSFDALLTEHELVKVRFDEFKEQKRELAAQLAERTGSRVVMQVGHVAVLYRPQPDPAKRRIVL
jgi:RNA-binding protein